MGKVILLLSVDWEGEDFGSLQDLHALRCEFDKLAKTPSHNPIQDLTHNPSHNLSHNPIQDPSQDLTHNLSHNPIQDPSKPTIPLTHFICPAYFVKYAAAPKILRNEIRPSDEVGLHIHPLRELVDHFNIPFRSEHNFYRPGAGFLHPKIHSKLPGKLRSLLTKRVTGRGVPLSVYTVEEIRKLIMGSRDLLVKHLGGVSVEGFRSGGNMLSDEVVDVLQQCGFSYDASAFPPEILSDGYGHTSSGNLRDAYGERNGLYTEYIMKLFGHARQDERFLRNHLFHDALPGRFLEATTQPFEMHRIIAFPINGGMADFAHWEHTLVPLFERLYTQAKTSKTNQVMSLGFHMEGHWKFKEPMLHFLRYLEENHPGNYEFATPVQFMNKHKMSSSPASNPPQPPLHPRSAPLPGSAS